MPGLGIPGSDASVDVQGSRVAWGLTIMKSAPNRENAIKFLQLLLAPGQVGQTTLEKVGPSLVSPAVVSAGRYAAITGGVAQPGHDGRPAGRIGGPSCTSVSA